MNDAGWTVIGEDRIDEERRTAIRRALENAGLDALVVRLPENVLLLSGFWPMNGASHVVASADGRVRCVVPDCYRSEAEAELAGVRVAYYPHGRKDSPPPLNAVGELLATIPDSSAWDRVGWEASAEASAPAWNAGDSFFPGTPCRDLYGRVFSTASLVDAHEVLAGLKLHKTPREIARLERASRLSTIGLAAFEEAVAPGLTGVELAAQVEYAVMSRGTGQDGARRVRAFAQVATGGEEGAIGFRPNEISTTRTLRDGDLALLELGVVVDGFWADRTRVRVAGTATETQRHAFDTVRRAQEAAIERVAPGVPAGEVDRAARDVIENAGLGELFPHITGHGVGFSYHEGGPIIRPGNTDALEAGMTHTIEPGVYSPDFAGGIRIEDDVLVTEDGARVLGAYRKELQG